MSTEAWGLRGGRALRASTPRDISSIYRSQTIQLNTIGAMRIPQRLSSAGSRALEGVLPQRQPIPQAARRSGGFGGTCDAIFIVINKKYSVLGVFPSGFSSRPQDFHRSTLFSRISHGSVASTLIVYFVQ